MSRHCQLTMGFVAGLWVCGLADPVLASHSVTFNAAIHADETASISPANVTTHHEHASYIVQHNDEHCQDHPACITFQTAGSPGAFNNIPGSSWRDIDSKTEALACASTYEGVVEFFVVRSIVADQKEFDGVFYGVEDDVEYNVIFVLSVPDRYPEEVYAHEYLHYLGLIHNTSCGNLVMNDFSVQYGQLDAITVEQAQIALSNAAERLGGVQEVGCDDGGAARLAEVDAVLHGDGVHVSFTSLWERNHDSFEVVRMDTPDGGTLYSLGNPLGGMNEIGRFYEIVDAVGLEGDWYGIVERQSGGLPDLGPVPVRAHAPVEIPSASGVIHIDPDSLAQAVGVTWEDTQGEQTASCGSAFPSYAIIGPDAYGDQLAFYAHRWNQRGINTLAVTTSLADSCFGSVREYIKSGASAGLSHVLLVGDANDHVMWDDSTKWINGWRYPTWWDFVGGSPAPVAHVPSQPENDIIPTFYNAVVDSPHVAWTFWTPYYATDLPYADVDDDLLPDVVVGRLPVKSAEELMDYVGKVESWISTTGGTLGEDATLVTWGRNVNASQGWWARICGDSMAASFSSGVQVTRLTSTRLTPWNDDSLRVLLNASANGSATAISWSTNWSDRYTYSLIWELLSGWSEYDLPATLSPFFSMGFGCGMNNFDQTEKYARVEALPGGDYAFLDPIRPIVERLVLSPGRGAIAQVGPTRAMKYEPNTQFARKFAQLAFVPSRSLGAAFTIAQRELLLELPEYRDHLMSYVYLGDPMLQSSNAVTGVGLSVPGAVARLAPPAPNPFNPSTTLRYYVPARSLVSLLIFDVHGKLVRRLASGEIRGAGWHEVTWDGLAQSGEPAGSGVYFARLTAGDVSRAARLVLIR